MSPGSRSTISDYESTTSFSAIDDAAPVSPFRGEPPPYKPPPQVQKLNVLETETKEQYRECVDEFKSAITAFDARRGGSTPVEPIEVSASDNNRDGAGPPAIPPRKRNSSSASADTISIKTVEENNENIENIAPTVSRTNTLEKQISVKEAMKKFNLIASEEEANKVTSPPAKKKPEKVSRYLHSFVFDYFA